MVNKNVPTYSLKSGRKYKVVTRIAVQEDRIKDYKRLALGTTVTFDNPESAVWFEAVLEDGTIIGTCCLVTDTGRCKSAIVDPIYRRNGVYAALFHERLKLAMQMKIKRLTTYTSEMSQPTYLAQGFIVKGRTKKALYMVKELFK